MKMPQKLIITELFFLAAKFIAAGLFVLLAMGFLSIIFACFMPNIERTERAKRLKFLSDAKQIGIALKIYSEDNEGKLPKNLNALCPGCIPNQEWLSKTASRLEFQTPGARLADLPPGTIILRGKEPDDKGRVAVVHADMSARLENSRANFLATPPN